jgi:hypothetical protein
MSQLDRLSQGSRFTAALVFAIAMLVIAPGASAQESEPRGPDDQPYCNAADVSDECRQQLLVPPEPSQPDDGFMEAGCSPWQLEFKPTPGGNSGFTPWSSIDVTLYGSITCSPYGTMSVTVIAEPRNEFTQGRIEGPTGPITFPFGIANGGLSQWACPRSIWCGTYVDTDAALGYACWTGRLHGTSVPDTPGAAQTTEDSTFKCFNWDEA